MALHDRLDGQLRPYKDGEKRHVHPVTGVLADYCRELPSGELEPRWNCAYPKHMNPKLCWYSVDEVAQQLGKSTRTVRIWLRSGALKGRKPHVGGTRNPVARGHWMINGAAVEEFLRGQTEVAPLPERLVQE